MRIKAFEKEALTTGGPPVYFYQNTSLGGRLTVGLQTLDLRIGVRIPASQPFIRDNLRPYRSHFKYSGKEWSSSTWSGAELPARPITRSRPLLTSLRICVFIGPHLTTG